MAAFDVGLVSLYLPGLPRPADPPRSRWRQVEAVLRSGGEDAQSALARAGLHLEAFTLSAPTLLARAASLLHDGRAMLCPPLAAARLGSAAPPAFWVRGSYPSLPLVAVVGSRRAPPAALRFARAVSAIAASCGYGIASGGAAGCDRAAVRGRPVSVDVLPCGFGQGFGAAACQMACHPPHAPFTTASAMERNTVLFAMSHAAVVCHAKFKEGGAWHAAVNALRRRLCPVFVWEDPDDTACRALIALGAMPLPSPDALPALLSQPHLASQAALFAGF